MSSERCDCTRDRLRGLTFEVRRGRRRGRPVAGRMIRTTWRRLACLAVGPRLDRGVRPRLQSRRGGFFGGWPNSASFELNMGIAGALCGCGGGSRTTMLPASRSVSDRRSRVIATRTNSSMSHTAPSPRGLLDPSTERIGSLSSGSGMARSTQGKARPADRTMHCHGRSGRPADDSTAMLLISLPGELPPRRIRKNVW